MKFQKTLASIVLSGAIGLTGCPSRNYQTGTVEKEYGTATQIVESSGALFGNESVKFGNPTYILQIKTTDGTYIASVESSENKKIEALALAIKEGDKVRFVVNDPMLQGKAFGNDKVGRIFANQIEILPKE